MRWSLWASALSLVVFGCEPSESPSDPVEPNGSASPPGDLAPDVLPNDPGKLAPGAALPDDLAIPATPDGPDRVRVLVRFAKDADRAPALKLIADAGATITYRYRLLPDLVAVRRFPSGAVPVLEALPGVAKVVPDQVRHANLQQSLGVMHATAAELAGLSDGTGVRVCVLDTGINQTHPAFAGAIAAQHDFVNNDGIAQDDNGHGSNVAGIIGSRDALVRGVAPGASLLVGKVLDAGGSGFDADIIAAIEWCTLDVAGDASNMSLGGGKFLGTCDFDTLAEAVNVSVDAGVVHLVAAGNEGNTNATGAPACASRAIAVAAVYDAVFPNTSWCLNSSCSITCTDTGVVPDKLTCFSNRAMKVDVAAPGCEINAPAGSGTGFASQCGTSQATPHVAGLVARLLGERPELRPNQVRAFLWNNANDFGAAGFDMGYGYGRVNALDTLEDPTAVTCAAAGACNDGDPCTADTCEGGFCAHRAACDDGNAATSDSCNAGSCTNTPVTLDDGRSCTTDVLDACGGPRYTVNTNGACNPTCATAVPLAIGQTVAGTTVGATKLLNSSCPGFSMPGANVVYRLFMRPEQAVTFDLDTNGTWDPGIYLVAGTSPTTCDVTRCVAGMDLGFGGDDEHMKRVRVPVAGFYFLVVDTFSSSATGTYTLSVRAECDPEDTGLACDDGSSCTLGDACTGTVCAGGAAPPECATDADCSDDDDCNGAEVCLGGTCQAGTAPNCNDTKVCTTDSCEPLVGCVHTPVTGGTPCADATVCNGNETCQAGECTAGTALSCSDDGNPCTTDQCDPVSGCIAPPVPNNTPCPDSDPCDGTETCQGGICSPGSALVCNDNSECTTDQCTTDVGCVYTPSPNNTPCTDDANLCNGAESCQLGACAHGTPLVCTDSDPCTTNSCSPSLGCQTAPAPNNTSCADTDSCNGAETCQGGLCSPGTPVVCNDNNSCTTDACASGSGCGFTAVPNGTGCNDNNACTSGESCTSGVCGGGTNTCLVDQLVFGVTTSVTLPGGVVVANEDLARRNLSAGTYAMYFDGSDVGLASAALAGFAYHANGDLVLVFTANLSIPGLVGGPNGTAVEARELVRFTPTSLGTTTSGTFTFLFDGSDVGLTTNNEAIDAVAFLADGSIIISTVGNVSVTGISAVSQDVLRFTPTALGSVTTGTWSWYIDGSDISLTQSGENIDALSVLADGSVLFSTSGNVNFGAGTFANEDVLRFVPTALGSSTSGTIAVYFDGSTAGFTDDIDALELRVLPQ